MRQLIYAIKAKLHGWNIFYRVGHNVFVWQRGYRPQLVGQVVFWGVTHPQQITQWESLFNSSLNGLWIDCYCWGVTLSAERGGGGPALHYRDGKRVSGQIENDGAFAA